MALPSRAGLLVLAAIVGFACGEGGGAPAGPAGARIAFMQGGPEDSNLDLYVVNRDGSGRKRLTDEAAGFIWLAWSPDGTRIAFVSYRDGNREIYLMNADGSDETNVSNNPLPDEWPAWSPDGAWLAFTSDLLDGRELYVVAVDGSVRKRLTNNAVMESAPAWSPDGGRIAFVGGNPDGTADIYSIRADGSSLTRPTSLKNVPIDGGNPVWSPDGQRVAYTFCAADPSSPVPPEDRQICEVYVVQTDGSGERNLTNRPGDDYGPCWSPDGRRIAFTSNRDGNMISM